MKNLIYPSVPNLDIIALIKAQQIKAFMSTHKEERKVFPAFGITDPTFEGLGSFEIIDAISQFYGVSLAIEEVEVIKGQGALETIEVKFT